MSCFSIWEEKAFDKRVSPVRFLQIHFPMRSLLVLTDVMRLTPPSMWARGRPRPIRGDSCIQ
jgi:hypothetical protein